MKSISVCAALAAGLLFTSLPCTSFAAENHVLGRASASAAVRIEKPMPISVVHPTELPSRFRYRTVEVALLLDETGTPQTVAPVGRMPRDLSERLLPAVRQWKFSPMYVDGKAVPVRVILPIELAEVRG